MQQKNVDNDINISHLCVQENISLADKNWFGTGGPARFFAEPRDEAELQDLLCWATACSLPLFILGSGANVLISDQGFDGLVLRYAFKTIGLPSKPDFFDPSTSKVLLEVGAGITIDELITWCLDNNFLGLEEFSGIPGTVGGSVFINLHYFEFLLSQFLVRARVMDTRNGQIHEVSVDWFNFGYNESKLQEQNFILLTATFALNEAKEAQIAYARGRRAEIIRHRQKRYPSQKTCGSFFRNFLTSEVGLEINGQKMIYVAYYLDKIGVKGALRIGGAVVSYQHANMLINEGHATSTDIVMLARTMQQMAYEAFKIILKAECRLIGFEEYPLL